MFNSIRGIITGKFSETLWILTGGVEWEIALPAIDSARLPPPGEEARIFTWLYHREDQMRLFGFADDTRRSTFLELLKVEGIGPRGALKIMGGIGQEALEQALEAGDLARLEQVPGLGKKTAQKMILALKGKLARDSGTPAASSPYGELAEALVEMGYDKRAAAAALEKAAAALEGRLPPGTAGAEREKLLFKEAIVYLSSS
ncbi:MAG: Holliday junction branch migration protein RuvA [Treponema sp.]|jgi:Holliday junction DNA helicase RuvA|nr:Holliday junction branch migration protein RuvA [Treponema sp.]